MIFRLSLLTVIIAVAAFAPHDAWARCEPDDYACAKFGNADKVRKKAKRRPRVRRARKIVKPAAPAPEASATFAAAVPPPAEPTVKTTVSPSGAPVTFARLRQGAISEAPAKMPNLLFRAGDKFERITARCNPVDRSQQRVSCTLATHRLALTSEAGAGCTGSLGLHTMEFAKSPTGGWVNEDSIALCGGRLLRRTELFPVAVNGQPQYALREVYKMLGGDSVCAAPYLRSRQPLRKAYLPSGSQRFSDLQCGIVASR